MGRWAQAKRRGGRPSPPRGLSQSPPPNAVISGASLQITPTGDDDSGGEFRIYHAASAGGPWSYDYDSALWDVVFLQPLAAYQSGEWLSVREWGNGFTYAGLSARSQIVQVP